MNARRVLWAAIAAGALGLVLIGFGLGERFYAPDEHQYDALARSLIAGTGYSLDGMQPTAWRPPAYSFFLAIIYWLTGAAPVAVRLVQVGLWALIVVLVVKTTERQFDCRTATRAGFALLFYLPLAFYTQLLLTEVFFTLWLAVTAYFMARYFATSSHKSLIAGAVAFGACALTRSILVLQLPLVIGLLLVRQWWKRGSKVAMVFGGVALLIVLVWTGRNWIAIGDMVLIDTNGGVNFYLGNNERTPTSHSWEAMESIDVFQELDALAGQALSETERQRVAARLALAYIGEHPGRFLALTVGKLFDIWEGERLFWGIHRTGGWPSLDGWVAVAVAAALNVSYVGVLGLSVVGLMTSASSPMKQWTLLLVVGMVLSYALAFGHSRFNVPFFVLLAPYAGYGITTLAAILERRGEGPHAWAAYLTQRRLLAGTLFALFLAVVWVRQVILDLPKFLF